MIKFKHLNAPSYGLLKRLRKVKTMANLEKIIQKFIEFLKTDIWRIRVASLGGLKSIAVTIVRIMLLSIRGFMRTS